MQPHKFFREARKLNWKVCFREERRGRVFSPALLGLPFQEDALGRLQNEDAKAKNGSDHRIVRLRAVHRGS